VSLTGFRFTLTLILTLFSWTRSTSQTVRPSCCPRCSVAAMYLRVCRDAARSHARGIEALLLAAMNVRGPLPPLRQSHGIDRLSSSALQAFGRAALRLNMQRLAVGYWAYRKWQVRKAIRAEAAKASGYFANVPCAPPTAAYKTRPNPCYGLYHRQRRVHQCSQRHQHSGSGQLLMAPCVSNGGKHRQ